MSWRDSNSSSTARAPGPTSPSTRSRISPRGRRRARLAPDPGRRRLQRRQRQRLRAAANPAPEGALLRQGPARLGAPYGIEIGRPPVFPVNSVKAMRGCRRARPRESCPYARAVFESYWGDLATSRRTRCSRTSSPRRSRPGRLLEDIAAGDQGLAAREHRRADRARRLRLAHDVRRRRRHVFRQRPPAAGERGATPPIAGRGLNAAGSRAARVDLLRSASSPRSTGEVPDQPEWTQLGKLRRPSSHVA